ncbi:MAG: DUF1236 domain-containing protein [Xanthobacteraceae bacterium]
MSTHLHHAAVALALVAGAGAAHAQTVITREITTEPVETIVERGPTGTVITRRPLDMTGPRAPVALPDAAAVATPIEPIVRLRETVGSSVVTTSSSSDTIATRRIAAPRAVASQRTRAATTQRRVVVNSNTSVRKPALRPAVSTARATARVAPAPRLVAAPPALTAAQRSTIYRTVVEERVVPRTMITGPIAAPTFAAPVVTAPAVREEIVTERLLTPPAPLIGERIVTRPLAVETVGAAPAVTERVVITPASLDLTLGSRVPATVPLYALPRTLGVQIPSVRSYRYAILDDRVLLVDPVTGVVVAELDQ